MLVNGLKFLVASHHLAKFSGHRSCGSSATAAKIFYVTLQDPMIKGSGDFKEGTSCISSKGHVTLWAGAHKGKLSCCQV